MNRRAPPGPSSPSSAKNLAVSSDGHIISGTREVVMSSPNIATAPISPAEHERRRLALQASVLNPLTDTFLRTAGISRGMRVLEVGCGIGEVSLITARLLGPHGRLHCVDTDGKSLEIAQNRVRSAGHDHVSFEHTDIAAHTPVRTYDAVIG